MNPRLPDYILKRHQRAIEAFRQSLRDGDETAQRKHARFVIYWDLVYRDCRYRMQFGDVRHG